eukprot:TRINITY_DN109983_c0_g1_i1.p1 TRINITY_DN109983_c0_g1~~TRINITY_DN109983_c0_g1_i1.p1  ORF type:complete len:400 (-),score=39.10 TRINITY_DN109983_c0_g1_i1:255-1454(-)
MANRVSVLGFIAGSLIGSLMGCLATLWHVNLPLRPSSLQLRQDARRLGQDGQDTKVFEAVAGGIGKFCRGKSQSDNSASNYVVKSFVQSLASCKEQCSAMSGCVGVEYIEAHQRCELWTSLIQASAGGPECWRVLNATTTTTTTTTSTTTTTTPPSWLASFDLLGEGICSQGIEKIGEYGLGKDACGTMCENRIDCFGFSASPTSSMCYMYRVSPSSLSTGPGWKCWVKRATRGDGFDGPESGFEAVNRSKDQSCRVANASAASWLPASNLRDCHNLCRREAVCSGVNFKREQGLCQLFSQPIQGTDMEMGSECWRYAYDTAQCGDWDNNRDKITHCHRGSWASESPWACMTCCSETANCVAVDFIPNADHCILWTSPMTGTPSGYWASANCWAKHALP